MHSEYVNLHLNFFVLIVKYSLPITDPTTTQNQATDTSPPSLREILAILYRNEHDMTAVKEVFGNGIKGMNAVTSSDPHSFKDLLLSSDSSVRSCFILVESTNIKEELLTNSNSTVYQDLLKTASWNVGMNTFSPLFFFLACVAWLRSTEWAQERTGHARETREARGDGAWLPLALPFFLSPKYFQAPATHTHVTVAPSDS